MQDAADASCISRRSPVCFRPPVVAAGAARSRPARPSAQKGRIFVSDVEFASYASDKEMARAIKKQGKTTFKGDGTWT